MDSLVLMLVSDVIHSVLDILFIRWAHRGPTAEEEVSGQDLSSPSLGN